MRILAAAIIALTLIVGCNDNRNLTARDSVCLSQEGARYFPQGTFGDDGTQDGFHRGWYSKSLARAAEPSLSCGNLDAETYRFLWLRTFDHPVVVRAVRRTNGGEITAVLLDGAGGYDPGYEMKRVHRDLTDAEWQRLQRAVDQIDFWKLPSALPAIGLDGSQWIVEGRQHGLYHVVDRWSAKGPFQALGLHFLELSGISPGEIY